jgi:hypothetical protein
MELEVCPASWDSASVGVFHLASSMFTFIDPGTLNASVPASIFAMGMMPGEEAWQSWSSSLHGVLPSVSLGCFAPWPRPDLIELSERLVGKRYLQSPETSSQLLHRAGPDDRSRNDRVVQQPSEGDVRRLLTKFATERLVRLEL